MTLTQLKDIVNETFDVNIEAKTRKRSTSYPKKVYCDIARSLNKYSLKLIGDCLDMSHDNVIYHLKTLDNICDIHKVGYNDIVVNYELDIPLMEVNGGNLVKKRSIISELPNYIKYHLETYSEDDLMELFQTRLKPFKMLLDSRQKQKEIKNIIGAKLIR